jgi:hypothetical protein
MKEDGNAERLLTCICEVTLSNLEWDILYTPDSSKYFPAE